MKAVVHSRIMAKEQEVASGERLAAEGGIASDESAVAEPEIEANEGLAEEHENEPDASTAAEGDSGEAGCPVRMGWRDDASRCGRRLHVAPDRVDERPVCLMHSKDPNKQSGPLFGAFWREFEKILEDADVGEANFERFVFPKLDLSKRKFNSVCRFGEAIFTQDANFFAVTFAQRTGFGGATFMHEANFLGTTFTHDAYFTNAIFTQTAFFWRTQFHGIASWVNCRFLDQAVFRRTTFDPTDEEKPSAVFETAKFSKPGEVVFDDVDLSQALFHDCDVSEVWFTSSVRWGKREGNRGLAVFEETIPLDQRHMDRLKSDGQRDYRAVAQIYQQLKKNYDSRLDYWTANEFHFGEMEMKRLAGPTTGPLLWLRRWWQRNLSFVALYRWASDYGNSYRKPALWLLFFILFLFPALFPLHGVGLKRQGATQAETYTSTWNLQKGYGENLGMEARLFGKSAITSVDTATFQRNAEYAPAYPWGRVLAIVETLLTSSLFALFLLAIRRQFRR